MRSCDSHVTTRVGHTYIHSSHSHLCSSIPVPARSGSRSVQAKGFFKGAVVSRGKDWNWGDQDGMEL